MLIPKQQKIDKYLGYLLIGILLPFTRFLGITLRRNHKLFNPPQNILFIKILGLGSLIVTIDSIKSIKAKYPQAKLILLTDSNIANGISPFKIFDELWTIKTNNIFLVFYKSIQFLVKSWRLKKLWVVDLEVYSKLTTVYSLMTFAINRFGFYLPYVFFRKNLNTNNVIFNQFGYLEDNYSYMAEIVTNGQKELQYIDNGHRKNECQKPYIALNNTCSDLALARKLPDDTFALVCQWLLENTSYRLALLGAPKDKEIINDFLSEKSVLFSKRERIINLSGANDNFNSYYRFLSEQCVCLITIDSGPLHIARKLGLPTLSIWGPTNPKNYLKVNPLEKGRHLYYYNQASCSPCIHHFEKLPCGGDNFCMKTIEANDIIRRVETLLNNIKATS